MGNGIVSKSLGFGRRKCWLKENTTDWVALIRRITKIIKFDSYQFWIDDKK